MCPNVITIIYFTFWSYFQGSYLHHKELKAAQGIKITAQVMLIPAYVFFLSVISYVLVKFNINLVLMGQA